MNHRMLCLVPLVFLLASCVPLALSDKPVGDPKTAPVDRALEGEWVCFAPGKDGEMLFRGLRFTRKEAGLWHLQVKKKDGWGDETVPVFTTIIGCDRYLNVGDAKQRYLIWKYSLSLDGTLMLTLMQEESVAKAIGEKRLQGKVARSAEGTISDVRITDSPENIRAYIEKEDPKKLFAIFGSFRKTGKQAADK